MTVPLSKVGRMGAEYFNAQKQNTTDVFIKSIHSWLRIRVKAFVDKCNY